MKKMYVCIILGFFFLCDLFMHKEYCQAQNAPSQAPLHNWQLLDWKQDGYPESV